MRIVLKFVQSTHRILGTLLSVLFLVWFLSGLVMIYHTFPKVSQKDRLAKMEYLTPHLASLEDIAGRLAEGEEMRGLTLNSYLGQAKLHIRTNKQNRTIFADSSDSHLSITPSYIQHVASLWCDAPIAKVDTLMEIEQWIPFGRLEKEMPIYKFHFSDTEKHQLYISSVSGKVLQFTDKESRFWAWVGAIPHWVYFTKLRQNSSLWLDTVIWLSGIGCIMCIAGIYWGIRDVRLARRKKRFTPYKKIWYKWHHIIGFVFGLFALTFTFSGMMSLAKVPKWLSEPKLEININREMQQQKPSPLAYALDYRDVIASYPNKIRQLEWGSFYNRPFYILRTDDKDIFVDASNKQISPLALTEEMLRQTIADIHGAENEVQIELLTAYDTYYTSRKRKLELPVWKISIEDVDNSCYYINPSTGQYRYVNNTLRWRYWMYPALHTFNMPWLVNRPILWNIVMWGTMLGGTLISLTGVVLGFRYFRRSCRKWRRKCFKVHKS